MRKKIVLFMLLLIFPMMVNAETYSSYNARSDRDNQLIYNIDKVVIDGGNITFSGWAYVNRKHTIGGKNYNISVVALKKSDLGNYNQVGSSVTSVEATENSYSGENDLFPSTCYTYSKNNVEYCGEVFYGYEGSDYNPDGEDKVENGSIISGVPYASCTTDQKTACIHYDPYFEITLSIDGENGIKSKLGTKDIVFVIKINYGNIDNINMGEGSGCRFIFDTGYSSGCNKTKSNVISRVLAFDESVMKKSGAELGVNVRAEFGAVFNNKTDYGRLMDDEFKAICGDIVDACYFELNTNFYISGSTPRRSSNKATGINAANITYYNLKVDESSYRSDPIYNDDGNFIRYNRYYMPSNSKNSGTGYWAPSTWGIVDGIVTFSFEDIEKPPELSSCEFISSGSCEVTGNTSCSKLVYSDVPGDFTTRLNSSGCTERAFISIHKVYEYSEQVDFSNISNIFTTTKNWPGLKMDNPFTFDFIRRYISSSPSAAYPNYYIYVKRYYDSNPDPAVTDCKLEDGYTNLSYLNGKGINIDLTTVDIDPTSVYNTSPITLEYDYPNSNEDGKSYTDGIITSKPSGSSGVSGYKINYSIKNAYININNGNVDYKDSGGVNELSKGNYYFIPLYIKEPTTLSFKTTLENVSLLDENGKINSVCTLPVVLGKLENYRYRVIDLDDPFPNDRGRVADNWHMYQDEYSSNTGFLKNRKSLEYLARLNPINIDNIRTYNKRHLYIDSVLNKNGTSIYLNENIGVIFNKNGTPSIKPVGESGVE